MFAGRTSCGIPTSVSRSRRRGDGRREDDARTRRAHRSSQSVTGPSFTSSTSIIAPNSPVSVVHAPLAQQRDEPLVERNGSLRPRRVDEARPPPFCGIAVQRELRHDEQSPPLRRRAPGSSSPRRRRTAGARRFSAIHVSARRRRVRKADQEEKSAADASRPRIVPRDPHFGARNPLQHDAHESSRWLSTWCCQDSECLRALVRPAPVSLRWDDLPGSARDLVAHSRRLVERLRCLQAASRRAAACAREIAARLRDLSRH